MFDWGEGQALSRSSERIVDTTFHGSLFNLCFLLLLAAAQGSSNKVRSAFASGARNGEKNIV